MNALPSSIETSLIEAGFSATEILIVERVLQEPAITLRQIAAKTGKSTGVLDAAMKKLVKKKIIVKETINDVPKYVLNSLEPVIQWIRNDVQMKRETLLRKYQNFESFIATLSVSKDRPEMKFFEGLEGMKQAYFSLLQQGEEMLEYFPISTKEEDDPLREFRVHYFRERRKKRVFTRIIAHDTPLARRFQSRDAFEYRQTVLVPPGSVPIPFEKIIVGDTIACLDHEEQKGCFIRFPEFAKWERGVWEGVWGRHLSTADHTNISKPEKITPISFRTRLASFSRDFFLNRRSILALVIFAAISGLITIQFYHWNLRINFQRMQDKTIAIAKTGALQVNPDDLSQLRQQNDYTKPEWVKVVGMLQKIRTDNVDIMYVYIFRRSAEKPSFLEFVADSHSLDPFANTDEDRTNDFDMNDDGTIDGSLTGGDLLAWPGQVYPTPPKAAFESFNGLNASSAFYEDQWGRVVTGYAPIKDIDGNTIAMFAVDMKSTKLDELMNQTFIPFTVFIGLFICFVIIRIMAYESLGWGKRNYIGDFCSVVTSKNN